MKHLLTILLSFTLAQAMATTIVVGKGLSVATVKEGIDMARNGDTILIKKGSYKTSNVVINKSITILGENFPELNGENKYEILILNGENIIVKGIHFNNSGYSDMNDFASVKIVNSKNVIVDGNHITNAYFGIHASNSSHFTITNNIFFGLRKTEQTSGNGIHLWKCDHALIENNNIQSHRDGIYFEFVTESLIRNNFSHDNIRYGLHFMFSHHNQFTNNTFSTNGAGIAVMYSHNVTMMYNRFEENSGDAAYGILLKEISDSKIQHNTFYKNTIALHLEGTTRIEICDNIFKENGWAAKVQASCSDNTFHHNNFFSNTFDVATNGTMVLNKFYNNYWDKYDGYDINHNGIGDVPYHPVSMYAMVIEENPNALILLRSFMTSLLEKAEKAIPSLTPENLVDDLPQMKALKL